MFVLAPLDDADRAALSAAARLADHPAGATLIREGQRLSTLRAITAGIVAICLNLIPLNQFMKRRAINSMRGIVVATVILVIVWVVYFGRFIF